MPAITPIGRRGRLGMLKNPITGPKSNPAPKAPVLKHNCCANPTIEGDGEGHRVCRNCYTQVDEDNIVADVTFAEDSRGAATVQGGFVGENARHARSSAAMRRAGGGERNTLQEVETSGRRALAALCPKLGIPETTLNQALRLYTLAAYNHNFAAGRRTDEVVGACLYAACRRQKDNSILLIDIAELLSLSVFRLGEVYKCMCQELYLDPQGGVGTQYLVEVESLVMKYCNRLEFEEATRQVAEDAIKIIRRMKRDWISTGRHPAGLCGAAIILAARMNNFRRSVREIVYVSKVADGTVAKRVEEFQRTKSASLTVQQFREYGPRLKHQADPPVLLYTQLREEKDVEKKRKRQQYNELRNTVEISDAGSSASSRESSVAGASPTPVPDDITIPLRPNKRQRVPVAQMTTPAPSQQSPQRDADGFAIPALPIAASQEPTEEPQPEKRKRGRPRKVDVEAVNITEEELIAEADLESNINDALNDQEIVDSRNELQKAKDEERAKQTSEQRKKIEADALRSRREAEGITWLDKFDHSNPPEEVTAAELEAIFADDPEVQSCELSMADRMAKEKIWVRDNADWLRTQHEKAIMKSITENKNRHATGKKKNQPRKTNGRKKRGKMGDGSTLAEATTPIETPADASNAMLEARAPRGWSKWVDYDLLRKIYAPSSASPSQAPSRPSATPSDRGISPDGGASAVDDMSDQDRDSASPTLPPTPAPRRAAAAKTVRLQSPPATQPDEAQNHTVPLPAPMAPMSPPQTQSQATAGAEREADVDSDADDYNQEDPAYASDQDAPFDYDGEDDREDIGEDDYYRRAIHPTGSFGLDPVFDEDDY